MLRSLHMKLVMIMVLLILSLMTVVGVFLINSVAAFYLNDFYSGIGAVVSDREVYRDLTQETAAEQTGEVSGVEMLEQVLGAYSGELGVNGSTRNYYILDEYGAFLAGTDEEYGPRLEYTENLLSVIRDRSRVGDESNVAADYMDVAIPIDRGDEQYIIYIKDNRATVDQLNDQLFVLIMQALVFGLVISVLLSLVLSKTMVIPIQRLTDGAERVAGGDFSDKLRCRALLYEVYAAAAKASALAQLSTEHTDRLDKVMTHLQAHYTDPDLSVEQLAALCGTSTVHFRRIFTQLYRIAPMKYITALRLSKARELLLNTDLPVGEISRLCGYRSAYYFDRVFKQEFGTQPLQLRKNSL